ncbi:hypothetical protein RFI_32624 [Reticulomyxa filosa]|uniref:Archaemetzincin-2 n=1 Tax=Reticulomyxa filosa TaxID=46433 RepID=X6LTS2_RETFI|nr:hypothetical protein RFI_32624 [Reticulomyxa filosa]|eukprot:ETO04771.1 hypothetical protein RFI_32624 [Reticulomyxa filosa]
MHEIGHTFGIEHCVYFQCVMKGTNHLEELDKQPLMACPICLKKLHFAMNYKRGKDRDNLTSLNYGSNSSPDSSSSSFLKVQPTPCLFDLVQRYQNLSSFFSFTGLKEEHSWIVGLLQQA